jgi:BirA family transcriptional regulator, biotin operon repressor / biotin---[acetyl-CoA-carboxylase] ligase
MNPPEIGLDAALQAVLEGSALPTEQWSTEWPAPDSLGLWVASGRVQAPRHWTPLEQDRVISHLDVDGRAWVRELELLSVAGSTNDLAMQKARERGIEGLVLHAEMQTAGRGRRGRAWISPLGGSLSLTLGFDWPNPVSSLSGLSPVVGLAVLDALQLVGAKGIGLKWPNDLLTSKGKLAGILIELLPAAGTTRVVVGVGINLRVSPSQRAEVDQPIDDLETVCDGLPPDRAVLLAVLVNHLVRFVQAFRSGGFEPFIASYDAHHLAHSRDVSLREGDRERRVRVLGIAADGGLKVQWSNVVEVLHGGEVSLRLRD